MDDDDFFRERIDPKLDMNSTEFSAKDYLATKHATTKYSVLLTELQSLKRSTSDKTEQLKSLVASHFDEYLSCHEAIREVAEEIRAHEADSELLTAAYQKLKQSTDTTLSLMLQRCEEQRKVQHAMAVLHRFRPMLEVPARLRTHLQQRDYLKLVEEYLQLKSNVAKANLSTLLKPVFDAAHATAVQANAALLQVIESPTASLATHREAIQALDWLQMVPKPALVCVKHQLAAVEKQLHLCVTAPTTDTPANGGKPVAKQPVKLKTAASTVAQIPPRSPVEIIRICHGIVTTFSRSVWGLVCDTMKAAALTAVEQEALHASVVAILTSTVKHLEDHLVGQCTAPDFVTAVQTLFVQLDDLKPCPDSVLNAKLVALKQRCCVQLRQEALLACLAGQTQRAENEWLAYVAQSEWTGAIDVLAKRSISNFAASTTRKGALTAAASAWHALAVKWWQSVHPLLVASTETNTSPSDEAHRTVFCPALYEGAASAVAALVGVFADSLHGLVDSSANDTASHAPLVALANAVEVHKLLSPLLSQWFASHPKHVQDILQPVTAMKEEFFQTFLAPRLEALTAALEAEEVVAASPGSFADDDADNRADNGTHGDESRQYLFSVLLLLVTWRHDIERTLPEPAFVDSLLKQCLAKIATHLEGRIRSEAAADAASTWRLTHLHVELAFVCTHFKRWMPQQAASLEATVLKALNTKRDVVQALASQLDLQTQMYRLCLSS